jgi:hypothetical protein
MMVCLEEIERTARGLACLSALFAVCHRCSAVVARGTRGPRRLQQLEPASVAACPRRPGSFDLLLVHAQNKVRGTPQLVNAVGERTVAFTSSAQIIIRELFSNTGSDSRHLFLN